MWWREASPRSFYKKSKLDISLDRKEKQSRVLYSLFLLYVQVKVYRNILKLRGWLLAFALCKTFSKDKKRSGTSVTFCITFEEKYFFLYILLTDQI